MKKATIFLVASLFMAFMLYGQVQTGSIRGVVTDSEGKPLPAVYIVVTSPALIGSESYTTSESGAYRIPAVPPGTYTMSAELSGFKTVKREGIIVHIGMIVDINVTMEMAAINEEVRVIASSPTVDIASSKIATTFTTDLLKNIPIARTVAAVLSQAPGAVDNIVYGSGSYTNTYQMDGININDPTVRGIATNIDFDAIDEIQVVTSGQAAEVANTAGGFLNVVTKSGGNKFSGTGIFYFTNDKMTQILFSDSKLKAIGIGKPVSPVINIDAAVNLGGPIVKDKLWFFGVFNYLKDKNHSPFIPATIMGKYYGPFDIANEYWKASMKLTGQISRSWRIMGMWNIDDTFRPYAEQNWSSPPETLYMYDHKRTQTASINAQWVINRDTFLELRGGLMNSIWPLPMQPGTENTPEQVDDYTGYSFGAGYRPNEWVWRNTWQGSVHLTHFQDNFIGGNHEFKVGADFQTGLDKWAAWKPNPMGIQYYNGNMYYYRGLYGLNGPHPVYGDGYVWFRALATTKEGSYARGDNVRIGAFVQDAWTIKNRLTINLGVRYDYSNAWTPEITHEQTAGVAYAIGEYYFTPKYGFNPYAKYTIQKWDNILQWKKISPRIGISYDIFGNGKTALKATYGLYNEAIAVVYYQGLLPTHPDQGFYYFNWWDLNNNGTQDPPPVDRYDSVGVTPENVLRFKDLVQAPRAPVYYEASISLQHELMENVSLSLSYINNRQKDLVESVLYDPNSQRPWYYYDNATDWWIPFTTIVPAHGNFPSQELTMYFPSKNSPEQLMAFANIPEAKRKYQAIQMVFTKRMSHGWQLNGSIIFSKQEGNVSGRESWGYSNYFDNANWFVNRYGRPYYDRPLVIKLFGTFALPYGILISFNYVHTDGIPWGRTVKVVPPSEWAAANNASALYSYTVQVEPPGSERYQGQDIVDLRIEKEFGLSKYGKIAVFFDVFNLLGFSLVNINEDSGGTWRPAAANTLVGTYTPAANYGKATSIIGARTLKVSVRYTF